MRTQQAPATLRAATLRAADLARVSGGTFTDRWGTDGTDTIQTGDGMDKIFGLGGNDSIASGGGTDEVHAGDGYDRVNAGAGDDKVFGGTGNDSLDGGAGQDELHGGEGDDEMTGGAGDGAADKAFGGEGNDAYFWSPGSGNDEFHGEAGYDTLVLQGMNLHQFQAALQLYDPSLRLQVNAEGMVTFLNQANQPVSFSGQITVGGETMKFFGIERIAFA